MNYNILQTVFLSFFSFYFLNALQSDNNSNTVYVLGHKCILGASQSSFNPCLKAWDKMNLSRAQKLFMSMNISSIVFLWSFSSFFGILWLIKSSLSFLLPNAENALQLIKALQAHNKYRTLHHSPPLNWSQGLASEASRIAQRLATQSMLVGKQDSALNLGQNLAKLAGWCKGNKCEKRPQAMWTQVTPASWCSHYRTHAHNYITRTAVRYSDDMYTRTPHREAALTCGDDVDFI